jgi:hypothetical protein
MPSQPHHKYLISPPCIDTGSNVIGVQAVGKLFIRKSKIKILEIDELTIKHLRMDELIVTEKLVTPDLD